MRSILLAASIVFATAGAPPATAQPVLHFEAPGSSFLGVSIALVGDLVAVGAPGEVQVFDLGTGGLVRTLTNPNDPGGRFGASLATIGSNLAVGDPSDQSGPGIGAVYLFDPTTGALLQTWYTPQSPCSNCDNNFGGQIAGVGGKVLVGAATEKVGTLTFAGQAYLFDASSGALLLTLQSPFPTHTGAAAGNFGHSVAGIGGDALVGAPFDAPSPGVTGAVYRFDGTTGTLVQQYPNPTASFSFAWVLGTVGANVLASNHTLDSVLLFDGTTAALLRTFTDPCPTCEGFGFGGLGGVGTDVYVGAPFSDVGGAKSGAVHVFDATTGTPLRDFLNPTPTQPGFPTTEDGFGTSLALASGLVAVGAPSDEGADGVRGGAAAVFYGGLSGCGPCETAGPLGSCVVAPHPTCRPATAGGGILRLTNTTPDAGDRVTWTWRGRAKTSQDFDHPLIHDYALCVYDESAPTPALLFRALAPAGGTCGGNPCWRISTNTSRVRYRDGDLTPEGTNTITMIGSGPYPTGRIKLRAKGTNLSNHPLGLPGLPPPLPLRVQLQARDGLCWESSHTAADASTSTRFSSRSD